jgi:hypothetical protein
VFLLKSMWWNSYSNIARKQSRVWLDPFVLPIIISTAIIMMSVLTICNYEIVLFGLTQQEVARRIGSSVIAVAHWEQGLKIPRPEWLGAFTKVVNTCRQNNWDNFVLDSGHLCMEDRPEETAAILIEEIH